MSYCPACGTQVTAGALFCSGCGAPVEQVLGLAKETRRPSAETLATQEQRLMVMLREATLGEYEILGEIGRGGMAVVYLGHDLTLDRKVAIKVMSPALMLMDAEIQQRFKREARTAAGLSHPNIIPVFAVKETKNLVYFVMKYIRGRSLESVITEVGALPLPVVRTILGQVGAALGYAHRHGTVHRDMKPGNVMLDEDGWVVVADFGIAKVAQAEALTVTGGVVGTPAYMSPEQCAGGDISGLADQYSVGVMAYEMITGRPPFATGTLVNLVYDHCHTPPVPLLDLCPDCPPEVANAVMRMLEKDPAQRWPRMEEAVEAFGASLEAQGDTVRSHLQTLGSPGSAGKLLEKFRTPKSPVPRSGAVAKRVATPRPVPVTRVTPEQPAERHSRLPQLVWGVLAIGVLGIAGWLVLRPRGPAAVAVPPSSPRPANEISAPIVARIDMTPLSATLAPGERAAFQATARDPGGQVIAGAPVTWESSAPKVASVSGDGVVVASGPGTAELRARSGNSSAAAVVTVTRATPRAGAVVPTTASVGVEPAATALSVGETVRLQGLVRDQLGNVRTGRTIRWSVTDPGVLRVSGDGVVTALGVGSARVELEVDGRTAAATIAVAPAPVATLELVPTHATLPAGGSVQLRALTRDRSGTALADRPVSWQSSDPQTAGVSPSGLVSGVAPGGATITATSGPAQATAMVVVEAVAAARVVDARPEIEGTIETYRRAIESRDLGKLRAAYPGLTNEQERAWRDFYGRASELTAAFRIQDLQISGDHATARVAATYDFRAERRQTQRLDLTMTLERGSGGWRLTTLK